MTDFAQGEALRVKARKAVGNCENWKNYEAERTTAFKTLADEAEKLKSQIKAWSQQQEKELLLPRVVSFLFE